MPADFAALQSRVNGAVFRRLANAQAVVGAKSYPIIFERPYDAALGGMVDASVALCQMLDVDLVDSALAPRGVLMIGAQSWNVTSVQPDGTGTTQLMLGLAS